MTSAGDGSYRYLINNVAPGTTVTVAVKIAYAGGMSVSPQVSYVVPDKASLITSAESTVVDVTYYDLSGCRISHPYGMCIMVKGSKATKLVMPVR